MSVQPRQVAPITTPQPVTLHGPPTTVTYALVGPHYGDLWLREPQPRWPMTSLAPTMVTYNLVGLTTVTYDLVGPHYGDLWPRGPYYGYPWPHDPQYGDLWPRGPCHGNPWEPRHDWPMTSPAILITNKAQLTAAQLTIYQCDKSTGLRKL